VRAASARRLTGIAWRGAAARSNGFSQILTRPCKVTSHSVGRDSHRARYLGIGFSLEPDQRDCLPLGVRHSMQRATDVPQHEPSRAVTERNLRLDVGVNSLCIRRTAGFGQTGQELIAHDRDEPGPQVRAGLPKVCIGERANQRVLDKVITISGTLLPSAGDPSQERELAEDQLRHVRPDGRVASYDTVYRRMHHVRRAALPVEPLLHPCTRDN